MLDTHTHILPNQDDGSTNLNTTITMIENSISQNTNELIATPHYCLGYGETKYNKVKSLVRVLNSYLKRKNINAVVYPGQEIYYNDNILRDYESGVIGTINDSRYMIIEFDLRRFDKRAFDVLYEMKYRGIVPVIAHPERYEYIIKDNKFINQFIEEGYLFQLNSGSLKSQFGFDVKRTAKILIKNNIYSFMGSDAHDCNRRNTGMEYAENYIKNKDLGYYNYINKSGYDMVDNNDIKFCGEKIKRRKIFIF